MITVISVPISNTTLFIPQGRRADLPTIMMFNGLATALQVYSVLIQLSTRQKRFQSGDTEFIYNGPRGDWRSTFGRVPALMYVRCRGVVTSAMPIACDFPVT